MYGYSGSLELLRAAQYPQLSDNIYLDHAGTTLYAASLVKDLADDLTSNLYGNPHSASKPSMLSGNRIDMIRQRALKFFNADPNEWDLVFVPNASAAIKMVSECLRDYGSQMGSKLWYGHHKDAHTSLVGVRELASTTRCFTSDADVDVWLSSGCKHQYSLGLFAYPGQSNMTGRRLPLRWCQQIRQQRSQQHLYTLLDAAALASTAPLDLGDISTAPDFVSLSFYKIFGFPSLGALLVQKRAGHVLSRRKYFGGGTVDMVVALKEPWHATKEVLHDRLEDGTLPFTSIFALDHAISIHEKLYGSHPMSAISAHTSDLIKRLYDTLTNLRHSNGAPVIQVYNDSNAIYGDAQTQGATISFNVFTPNGDPVGYETVERAADQRSIYVRSGSLCNPGGMASYLQWSPAEMKEAFKNGHRCSKPIEVVNGKPTGVVRVSLGAMSTVKDIEGFVKFVKDEYVVGSVQEDICAQPHRIKLSSTQNIPVHDDLEIAQPTLAPVEQSAIRSDLDRPNPDMTSDTANDPSTNPRFTGLLRQVMRASMAALPTRWRSKQTKGVNDHSPRLLLVDLRRGKPQVIIQEHQIRSTPQF